jgi:hypothetical protein
MTIRCLNIIGGKEEVKNFDQWTEELSKEIFARTDQEDMKVLWKWNEILDDDSEEEE